MLKTAVALTLIGAISGGLLTFTQSLTAPYIENNRERQAQALLRAFIPEPLHHLITTQSDWQGQCDVAIIARTSTAGYAGPIDFVSLWRPAHGLRLRVVQHRETPGIGDFIDHRRDTWLPKRDDHSASQWQTVDTVTGATITSRAVYRAAQDVLHSVEQSCG